MLIGKKQRRDSPHTLHNITFVYILFEGLKIAGDSAQKQKQQREAGEFISEMGDTYEKLWERMSCRTSDVSRHVALHARGCVVTFAASEKGGFFGEFGKHRR